MYKHIEGTEMQNNLLGNTWKIQEEYDKFLLQWVGLQGLSEGKPGGRLYQRWELVYY